MNKKEYQNFAKRKYPSSPILKNCIWAFFIGGAICMLGEWITEMYKTIGFTEQNAGSLTSVTLIFLSVIFTGFGLYSKLAHYAGAGTIVPITGFANAVASPAIEAKTEGFVLGVAAKIFTIAGPVIVYGTVASIIAGMIYLFI